MEEFYKKDPKLLEDWEDLILWKKSSNNIFKQTLVNYLQNKIVKVTQQFLLDCIVDKKYSEISLLPGSYDIEFDYEVSGLFINQYEKFFILKKNNEFYALDVSLEYEYIR